LSWKVARAEADDQQGHCFATVSQRHHEQPSAAILPASLAQKSFVGILSGLPVTLRLSNWSEIEGVPGFCSQAKERHGARAKEKK
jgi:hypothetical protein